MICKSGNFNVTTEENVDDISTKDTNLIIELKPEIIKESSLPGNIQLAVKDIDFNKPNKNI